MQFAAPAPQVMLLPLVVYPHMAKQLADATMCQAVLSIVRLLINGNPANAC